MRAYVGGWVFEYEWVCDKTGVDGYVSRWVSGWVFWYMCWCVGKWVHGCVGKWVGMSVGGVCIYVRVSG